MKELKYTLLADGSSDKTLLKIIKWSLDNLFPQLANQGTFADFRILTNPPKKMVDKVSAARYFYPFDVLFIHRDAETTNVKIIEQRLNEIKKEIGEDEFQKTVCIVPIKMMEAWLLIDIEAIKKAAGNRNYPGQINLPPINNLEKENQPKNILHDLLKEASGLKSRNLKKFNPDKAVHLVAENIEDFSPLRNLNAFQAFERNLIEVVNNLYGNIN
jgi:hypothetical protein